MKRLGKNKKKRWQYCYKDLESKLQDAEKHRKIIKQGFTEVSTCIKKRPIVKGDKDSAKSFRDIPSASDGKIRIPRTDIQKKRRLEKDVWEDNSLTALPTVKQDASKSAEETKISVPLPCAGQSYNPTLQDHLSLMSRIEMIESAKRKREMKTERFVESLRGVKTEVNPVRDMKKFLQSLNDKPQLKSENEEPEVLPRLKKPKKVNVQKRMKHELENLPKLLKEIKREKTARSLRKSSKAAKREMRNKLKTMDMNIPFHLPNEIPSSLRKLCPEGYLIHEIERRRNKCPRARKTLGNKRNNTSFERKRETNISS
uniref:Ribosome biogenesis protein NOP53 n=1 Tax=Trichobilharzia regenti TaxID=157069 RepID=A0AA85JLD0_TRIRE|nr:unnamed protein product [Trichobilharzia regenti]